VRHNNCGSVRERRRGLVYGFGSGALDSGLGIFGSTLVDMWLGSISEEHV
jgi:hypothetical protein